MVWLPPSRRAPIVALGLNYADHAKELAFNAQEEPLVFLKGPGTLIGHRGIDAPSGGREVHALRMRAGRGHRASGARTVSRAQAMQHVAGYCIANDYAIRDYLENWYRPNLRVKNRDGATVLGPWFVDAGGGRGSRESGAAHVRQRQTDPAGQHPGSDFRHSVSDRILELVHDSGAGRCDIDGYARRRRQRHAGRRGGVRDRRPRTARRIPSRRMRISAR